MTGVGGACDVGCVLPRPRLPAMEAVHYESLVGVTASLERAVAATDTAQSLGSGEVPVLATPRLLAWLEAATVLALDGLPEALTSVGTQVQLNHLRPTAVGHLVRCTARVVGATGRSIEFEVQAVQAGDEVVVARGTVVRALVDRARFLDGLDWSS